MANANRFQPQTMVELLERIGLLERELHEVKKNLQQHWCTHLFENGSSAIPTNGNSWRFCSLCGAGF